MRSIRKVANGFAFTILLLFAAVTVALLASCASTTEINGAWVNPEAGKRRPVHNVLVIGINRDDTARRIYEDAIVAQLAARGIKAQPSYELLLERPGPAVGHQIGGAQCRCGRRTCFAHSGREHGD